MGSFNLRCTTVDDEQLRWIGKFARLPRRRVDSGKIAGTFSQFSLVALESTGDHLGNRPSVVRVAVLANAANGEASILRGARETIFKDHKAGDDVCAGEMAHINTLNAQWCLT